MKKLFKLFIIALFLCVSPNFSDAAIISYSTLSGDNGVSFTHLNNSFSTIYNDYNGNITTNNLLARTLSEDDFADAINPRVRDNEFLGSFTYTGMLPATSANLTSNISAGTSYINGYRIVTSATSRTYTASRDTWVYIDINGAFQYSEVANGAAQPATPANSLLLATVVTNGTAITAVTDRRQTTPPNLRVYQNYKQGIIISRDISTANRISVDVGEIEFGSAATSGRRRNTAPVYVTLSTAGREGLDTGTQAADTYYYLWAYPDPDNSTNFEVLASTSRASITAVADVANERLVGWFYSTTASVISVDSVGAYRRVGGDAPNIIQIRNITNTATSSNAFVTLLESRFYASGRPILLEFSAPVNVSTSTGAVFAFTIDGISYDTTLITDADNVQTQTISLRALARPEEGTRSINVVWHTTGGVSIAQNGATEGAAVLTVQEL